MKYIKQYESYPLQKIKYKPQIGEYVLMKSQAGGDVKIFIDKTIGKISRYDGGEGVYIEYPKNNHFLERRLFNISQIITHSTNKEDIEQILLNNKFNL